MTAPVCFNFDSVLFVVAVAAAVAVAPDDSVILLLMLLSLLVLLMLLLVCKKQNEMEKHVSQCMKIVSKMETSNGTF